MYAEALGVDPEFTSTTRRVVGLLTSCGLLSKGYRMYVDNYYNSPELADELDSFDTYICRTLRLSRKQVPESLKLKTKLDPGEVIFRKRDNILIVKYHDKQDVTMLSTFHKATMTVMQRPQDILN